MSRYMKKEKNLKAIKIAVVIAGCVLVALLSALIYNNGLTKTGDEPLVGKTNTSNYVENTESASAEIGKSINESKNETLKENTVDLNNVIKNNTQNTVNTQNVENTTNTNKNNVTESKSKQPKSEVNSVAKKEKSEINSIENVNQNNTENSEKKELNFEKPVDGEVVKEFSKDSLIYSNTLQEWTIHTGIDIKADKTTVVKSVEEGTVKSIKNDPRYGLTVVIEHRDGFQTVYSNLLTSEFVTEGENVKKGQSIGTVGNTASFEIADEPHLHFEVLKDSVQVDPNIYIEI